MLDRAIDKSFEQMFDALYWDLRRACPSHPFDWMHVLRRPPFWRRKARAAHIRVRATFAAHGFILTDDRADAFFRAPPQQFDEDCGGSIVRRLRQAFQYQTGVPYA